MSFKKDNSLRRLLIGKIDKKHPELLVAEKFPRLNFILNYLNRRERLWIIPFIVICCYVIFAYLPWCENFSEWSLTGLIYFDDIKSAATLIDQRTSNIATIISMTLAVTAILLSNMAIKETLVYDLLYKRSKLNLIIIYTLSVIGSLIIVGTTKDSYPKENPYIFYRGVVTGTYLVIVILFMIGHLFKVVYEFSSSSGVKSMLSECLYEEARENLRHELIRDAATKHLQSLFSAAGFSPFSYFAAAQKGIAYKKLNAYSKVKSDEEKFVHDADLKKMTEVLRSKKLPLIRFIRGVTIDQIMDNHHHLLFLDTDDQTEKELNMAFHKSLNLKQMKDLPIANRKFQKYFAQKLIDSVEQEKPNELREVLNHYEKIRETEIIHKSRL